MPRAAKLVSLVPMLVLLAVSCTPHQQPPSLDAKYKSVETANPAQTQRIDFQLPLFAPAGLRGAYVLALQTCSDNAALSMIRDMVSIKMTVFGFTCGTDQRLHISYSTAGVLQGAPTLVSIDPYEQPLPLAAWRISSAAAMNTALSKGGADFLHSNPGSYAFSQTLSNNTMTAIDNRHPFEWDIEFVTPAFSKQLHIFIDAGSGTFLGVR